MVPDYRDVLFDRLSRVELVTVAKAEEDGLPQTVCKDNVQHDWATDPDEGGEIIGIPQEKIHSD